MCSEIDERTRENPEGAMRHTELLDVQLHEMQKARAQELARIQEICGMPGDERYEARTKAAAQAYNSAWPWPVGVKEVALEHNALVQRLRENAGVEPKPEAQHFDTEAHRAFMRGLG
ncbi:hypothetical protein R75461_01154 [Paraburkholderia nemoris]|uniref:hypothetical protein n=1 Tax=Paraburkholderia nemoris TaxID=2793076 RepID=UPI001B1CFAEC|nr:hypothetical protein [Paraburkholderia nemoris]CAE6713149.1 hypothetical protein R75461_01154 [Paraburkholderia nemoris]